jgi:hypothetical protein
MAAYFKLGPKAISYSDPIMGISIAAGNVIKLSKTPTHKLFISRLKGGAIRGASEEEYNKFMGIVPEPIYDFDREELESMTVSEIIEDATEQEVSKAILESFKKLKKAEIIKILLNL